MKIITPVVVIAYNRPTKTLRLLNCLKKIKLSKIIFICDGPKQNNNLDKNKCKKVNNLIKKIKLNCKKEYIISTKNLGLRNRIYSGLNQVFKKYDRAIILEDDCIPNISFFYFCEKTLKIYSKNKKIAGISGNNFFNQKIFESYYFSNWRSIVPIVNSQSM